MNEKRSKFQGLFDPAGHEEPASGQELAADSGSVQESKIARKQDSKNIRNQEPADVFRMKTNYEIRQDYHRKLKHIANDEGRKMYQVIEEAIGRYLKAKGRL